ncbi:hypothetical protein COT62_02640 [Candidatus Roizmanbacteria bacterium CG09_land_8_20_14_0_10_41_9]|uniref:mevalonate kinase n=1 Tax=Candidatus Roizmanbacteria bacterium CG09_land_8_20_14_0_10_41_9 TaxID=1974850 RepID=A0A2H0WSL5_9BACT|nr:MAG: hypothetical protein COT62_02640 [Candidatus Roizmanbacteria bacterium CG09_land_8_20_14_0_10_41_9]
MGFSAPAKVIISGEHAVVYGRPALVSAIHLRLTCSLDASRGTTNTKNVLFVAEKVKEYLTRKKITFRNIPFRCKISSDIPIGRGLGSSAAFSVATTAAFLFLYTGREFDKETISDIAHEVEKRFHQNASGVDTCASCFGGLIYYRKEFKFLKKISPLPFKVPKIIEDRLYLIDSGKPAENTAEMVRLVEEQYAIKPARMERILNMIEKSTKKVTIAIAEGNQFCFKKALQENQRALEKLKVVSGEAKRLLLRLKRFGVGKITGAGGKKQGSGFILFYTDDNDKFENYCQKKKVSYFKFVSYNQGVVRGQSS